MTFSAGRTDPARRVDRTTVAATVVAQLAREGTTVDGAAVDRPDDLDGTVDSTLVTVVDLVGDRVDVRVDFAQ